MQYDFDKTIDRHGSGALATDELKEALEQLAEACRK